MRLLASIREIRPISAPMISKHLWGSRRPACCGVRSGPGPPALARARRAERSGGRDGSQARLWERLFGIVDEYLREDRPR